MEQETTSTDLRIGEVFRLESEPNIFFKAINLIGTSNPDKYDIVAQACDKEGIRIPHSQEYRLSVADDDTLYVFNRAASKTENVSALTRGQQTLSRWLNKFCFT